MHSKGNVPANGRRMELAELQAAANRVNTVYGQPSFDSRAPIHDPNWLWDALDMDMASSSIDLTGNNALITGMPEAMGDYQWFWAGDGQQNMSAGPMFDSVS